jgi:hypothetical protein
MAVKAWIGVVVWPPICAPSVNDVIRFGGADHPPGPLCSAQPTRIGHHAKSEKGHSPQVAFRDATSQVRSDLNADLIPQYLSRQLMFLGLYNRGG